MVTVTEGLLERGRLDNLKKMGLFRRRLPKDLWTRHRKILMPTQNLDAMATPTCTGLSICHDHKQHWANSPLWSYLFSSFLTSFLFEYDRPSSSLLPPSSYRIYLQNTMNHVLQTAYAVAAPDLDGWVVLPLLFLIRTFIRNILFTYNQSASVVPENSHRKAMRDYEFQRKFRWSEIGEGPSSSTRWHTESILILGLSGKRNTPLSESSLSNSVVPGVGIKDPSRVAISYHKFQS
jgi:hypothetical protein